MSAEGTSLVGGVWVSSSKNQNAIFYPRILLATRLVTGCTITGTLCKLDGTLQIVHIHANFNRGFLLPLVYYLHTPWTNQFLGYENGKQFQVTTIKITESKENKSIRRLDLSGSTGPGGSCITLLLTQRSPKLKNWSISTDVT